MLSLCSLCNYAQNYASIIHQCQIPTADTVMTALLAGRIFIVVISVDRCYHINARPNAETAATMW